MNRKALPKASGWKRRFDMESERRRNIPYRLPQLLNADEAIVYEGEKDAERLVALGFVATTNSGGAGKWRPEFADFSRTNGPS